MRGTCCGACLAVVLSACSSEPASDGETKRPGPVFVPYAPTPDPIRFIAHPNPLPDVPPGTILNWREVVVRPAAGTPLENPAWQLQIMSKDAHGNPQAAIATVVKPASRRQQPRRRCSPTSSQRTASATSARRPIR